MSHLQQAMRIAINTGVLALIRLPELLADWYSVSVFQRAGFTQSRRAIAGIWLANLRAKAAVASTFQRNPVACVD